jgi:hypothetical protein
MTHATRFAAVAVLVALGVGAPVQAQTPEIDTLRARAEAGVASAPFTLAFMYSAGQGVRQCEGRDVKSVISGISP